MSRINLLLNRILSTVYGRDVRQSIHDSIEQCYTDVSTAKTLADDSIAAMTQRITDCNTAAEEARVSANTANASASSALTAASEATASAVACDLAVTELPNHISEAFADLGLVMEDGKLCVEVIRE